MNTHTSLLRQYSRQLVREWDLLNSRIGASGCTLSECHALLELYHAGQMSIGQLAKLLLIDLSTASRLVKALVEKGLAETFIPEWDKRQKSIQLTSGGRKTAEDLDQHATAQVNNALSLLLPQEVELINRGMACYARALRQARLQRDYLLRPIQPEDDTQVAHLIREVMTEFGAVGKGFSIQDPEVDHMCTTYSREGYAYFVIEKEGRILGAGGIGPLVGGGEKECELKKMYFYPELRGLGLGKKLLLQCLEAARDMDYQRMYLETLKRMSQASGLYEKMGFRKLDSPMGRTGHSACDAYYAMEL